MGRTGSISQTYTQSVILDRVAMQIKYQCRIEKALTTQTIVKVTDNLPAYVEVIQCNSCGALGVAQIDTETAYVEL
jgi:hypothetical protein